MKTIKVPNKMHFYKRLFNAIAIAFDLPEIRKSFIFTSFAPIFDHVKNIPTHSTLRLLSSIKQIL